MQDSPSVENPIASGDRTALQAHPAAPDFRALIDQLPSAAYTCDVDGRLTYYNPEAARLWGRTPVLGDAGERFCGSHRTLGVDGRPVSREESLMARALRSNQEFRDVEVMFEQPLGARITARANVLPLRDAGGRVVGGMNVFVDVTEQKQEEEERRRLEMQILHAQKLESLGVLAGGIAHDFNNLLTAVLGHASMALMELPARSETAVMLREIVGAARRAADLSRQMLAYSGRGEFLIGPVQVEVLVQEMTNLLDSVISKKAEVRLELEPALIEADATQIRQVVMNLITNASDALGGREGEISVRTGVRHVDAGTLAGTRHGAEMPAGDYAFIEVSDNGCGMKPETVAKIFDPFFTTKFAGRGLGLAAVLGIVRGHRGTIRVTSESGRGTRFEVLVPVSPVAPEEKPESFGPEIRHVEGRILVVDDDENVRKFARQVLERAGFEVIAADDGRDGLTAIEAYGGRISAILLDLTMRHMDGADMLARMRHMYPTIPVLMMSGYCETEVASRVDGMGVAGFIQKPFDTAHLLARVNAVSAEPV